MMIYSLFVTFSIAGIAHERLIRLSPDNRYVEWETSFFSFKPKDECRGSNYYWLLHYYCFVVTFCMYSGFGDCNSNSTWANDSEF